MQRLLVILGVLTNAILANAQWVNLNSPTSTHLYSTYFTSHDTGYAVGGNLTQSVFLKTINGGVDWNLMTNTQTKWLYDVFFINDSTGLACGYEGAMYKTTDYGASWQAKASETTEWLYAMSPKTADTIFAVGANGTLLRSDNGGNNWQSVTSNTGRDLFDIHFYNNQYGAAVGAMGEMIYTTDGGNNWAVKLMGTINSITGVWMVGSDRMWACGYSGELYYTNNGGQNFTLVIGNPAGSDTINRDFNAIYFVDDNNGYITGDRMILQTTNGGVTWHFMNYPTINAMNDIFVTSDNVVGYTVGANGSMLKNVNTIGLEESTLLSPAIYPNPGSGLFNIALSGTYVIQVFDIHGRVVKETPFVDVEYAQLDLTDLQVGEYVIGITQNGNIGFGRVIVIH